jgi:hypothetical protein
LICFNELNDLCVPGVTAGNAFAIPPLCLCGRDHAKLDSSGCCRRRAQEPAPMMIDFLEWLARIH